MIIDTSVLLALYNDIDPDHEACRTLFDTADEALVLSPYVVAEIDYIVTTRLGVAAELALLAELGAGGYELANIATADLVAATAVVERYRDQEVGITDASLVVLADRYNTRTIATLDQRHFSVLRPLTGGRFRVVP